MSDLISTLRSANVVLAILFASVVLTAGEYVHSSDESIMRRYVPVSRSSSRGVARLQTLMNHIFASARINQSKTSFHFTGAVVSAPEDQ